MEIEFYQTAARKNAVAEFLDDLPDKELAKVIREIELLEQYGTELREPHTKHIEGPIWELRIKFSTNSYRIFYFIWDEHKIVLLHSFAKKTQRTPVLELKAAKRNWKDYVERHENNINR